MTVVVAGDEPFLLCLAALAASRVGHPCVVQRTAAPPGTSDLGPWPRALLADPGFRRFVAAEFGLGWPGATVSGLAELDDAVGLEARLASALATAGLARCVPPSRTLVRRRDSGGYGVHAAVTHVPDGSPWSAALSALPALDMPPGSVLEASCLVLAGFAAGMVGDGWWRQGDPHLFGVMAGRAPRATRRDDIEAGVADVRSLSRGLPVRLGPGTPTKKSSTLRKGA